MGLMANRSGWGKQANELMYEAGTRHVHLGGDAPSTTGRDREGDGVEGQEGRKAISRAGSSSSSPILPDLRCTVIIGEAGSRLSRTTSGNTPAGQAANRYFIL
jgi:hypothetical protein